MKELLLRRFQYFILFFWSPEGRFRKIIRTSPYFARFPAANIFSSHLELMPNVTSAVFHLDLNDKKKSKCQYEGVTAAAPHLCVWFILGLSFVMGARKTTITDRRDHFAVFVYCQDLNMFQFCKLVQINYTVVENFKEFRMKSCHHWRNMS